MNIAPTEPAWDLYRSFLAVLRLGSLSAAARELGLAQPTLGRHIESLEAALGVTLFIRSPHGFSPTTAAERMEPYARTMAANAAALMREVIADEHAIRGAVSLTASEVVSIEILPAILAPLQKQHPELTIELEPSNQAKDLLGREADIAVRMFRPTQKALLSRKVGDIEIGWHAHKDYLSRHAAPSKMEDLALHRLIGFRDENDFIRKFKRDLKMPDLAFAFKSNSDLAILSAIRAGCGIGLCQNRLALRDPNLVRVLPRAFKMPLTTWVTMHENLKKDPRHRVVFNALVEGLQSYIGLA